MRLTEPIALLCSLIISAIIAVFILESQIPESKVNFEEFGLDHSTTSFFPKSNGHPIHILHDDDLASLVSGWEARGKKDVALWLGNSQLHAINQSTAGSTPASKITFDRFSATELDVLTWSIPNANTQEQLLLVQSVKKQLPLKYIIVAVCFDDFRETGIRNLLDKLQTNDVNNDNGKTVATVTPATDTFQDRSEAALESSIARQSRLFASRDQLRGKLISESYLLRNRILGITPQSKRRILKANYAQNMNALQEILDLAAADKIQVVSYIVPLRNDIEVPYVESEYEDFKRSVKLLCESNAATFVNLESLVPGEFWGTMASIQGKGEGLDFMHFQGMGHELLADAISSELNRMLLKELKNGL